MFDIVLCADSTGDPKVVHYFERFAPMLNAGSIQVIVTHGGTAGITRNAGFKLASTEWVSYLDGDDILLPEAIEEVIRCAASGHADIINTGLFRIGADGTPREMPESLTYKPPVWLYFVDPRTLGHWAFFNQLMAIKRELWRNYPFAELDTNREDVDFMLHQLLSGRVVRINKALYGYRELSDGFSSRRYEKGDICAARYDSGYYAQLFTERYRADLADNFL